MKFNSLILLSLFLVSQAFAAQPVTFTYQGKALNASGTAPLLLTVALNLSITDPSGACTLYQETQSSINLAITNGLFSVQVGSNPGNPKRTALDPGLSMSAIFANAGTQLIPASGSCTSGYTPTVGDTRKLHVVVTPASGSPITITPDLTINSVPNAMVADTLQGSSLTQVYVPVGMVLPFAGAAACPTGYLATDGSTYVTTNYPALFGALSYSYGGSGTSFNVPNTSGLFIRGSGSQTVSGITYTGTQGATQNDLMQGHFHEVFYTYSQGGSLTSNSATAYSSTMSIAGPNPWVYAGAEITDGVNGTPRTGAETRPANVSMKYCIKY